MSTVTAGRVRAGRAGGDDERGSRAWAWLVLLAALALVGFLVAWLGGWIRFTTDPRVTEILAMQEEARAKYAANGGPTTLVDATAAVASMAAIRQKIDALPENLRPQVERAGRTVMRDAFRGRIDAYFAAAPDQRRAELDRQIDQEEVMRKAFEAGQAIASAVGGGQPASGGDNRGGGGPPSGGSEEDRNRWRKNMIDRTTPEQRARYVEYRRAMEQRRTERGLPAGGPR